MSRTTASDGFRRVLRSLADDLTSRWPSPGEPIDPDRLHALRVAIRTSRTVLANAKRVLPRAIVDEARAELRRLARAMGPLRDLDVLIEVVSDAQRVDAGGRHRDLPHGDLTAHRVALAGVAAALREHRRALERELAGALVGGAARDWLDRWRTWLAADVVVTPDADRARRRLRTVLRRRIRRAQRRLLRRGRSIAGDSPAERLHELRKDVKRLRYLIVAFRACAPKRRRKRFVGHLRELQDALGAHHDAVVQLEQLRRVPTEVPHVAAVPGAAAAVDALRAVIDGRRARARRTVVGTFARYDRKQRRAELSALIERLGR